MWPNQYFYNIPYNTYSYVTPSYIVPTQYSYNPYAYAAQYYEAPSQYYQPPQTQYYQPPQTQYYQPPQTQYYQPPQTQYYQSTESEYSQPTQSQNYRPIKSQNSQVSRQKKVNETAAEYRAIEQKYNFAGDAVAEFLSSTQNQIENFQTKINGALSNVQDEADMDEIERQFMSSGEKIKASTTEQIAVVKAFIASKKPVKGEKHYEKKQAEFNRFREDAMENIRLIEEKTDNVFSRLMNSMQRLKSWLIEKAKKVVTVFKNLFKSAWKTMKGLFS